LNISIVSFFQSFLVKLTILWFLHELRYDSLSGQHQSRPLVSRGEMDTLKAQGLEYLEELNRAAHALATVTSMNSNWPDNRIVSFPDTLPTSEQVNVLCIRRRELCERVTKLTQRLRDWNAID